MGILCKLKIHHLVVKGTGMMGDGLFCLACGRDEYPESFGFHLKAKEATKEDWKIINKMRKLANG